MAPGPFQSRIHIILDLGMTGISASYLDTEERASHPDNPIVHWITAWPSDSPANADIDRAKLPACLTSFTDGRPVLYGFESRDQLSALTQDGYRGEFKKIFFESSKAKTTRQDQNTRDYQNLLRYALQHTLLQIEHGIGSNPVDETLEIHFTTPASWDESENYDMWELLKDAAAELIPQPSVRRHLNEGICAAAAANAANNDGKSLSRGQNVLVLDIGGLTIDACTAQFTSTGIPWIISSNSAPLGTETVQGDLFRMINQKFKEKDPQSTLREQKLFQIIKSKEWAKWINGPASIKTSHEMFISGDFRQFINLEREWEEAEEVFKRYIRDVHQFLRSILRHMTGSLDAIQLTGGGRKMERLRTAIQDYFHSIPHESVGEDTNVELPLIQPRLAVNIGLQIFVKQRLKEVSKWKKFYNFRFGMYRPNFGSALGFRKALPLWFARPDTTLEDDYDDPQDFFIGKAPEPRDLEKIQKTRYVLGYIGTDSINNVPRVLKELSVYPRGVIDSHLSQYTICLNMDKKEDLKVVIKGAGRKLNAEIRVIEEK